MSNFIPDWREQPPEEGTYRSIFKWGAPDKYKHPNKKLFEMMKKIFNMSDDDFLEKKKQGNEKVKCGQEIKLTNDQITVFKNIVSSENVQLDDYSRVKYSHGKTMEEALKLRNEIVEQVSDIVVHPRNKNDVMEIIKYCNEQKIPVHVYGGGSSVTLGLKCPKGGVTLVMGTHMNRFLNINETNQTATVEPGIMGPEYESILNDAKKALNTKSNFTCGHFPQSFEYSSVGGWVVTLGSGQQSSYYGDVYDLVVAQEYVTPAGYIKTHNFPATATGPKINDIMIGNEGTFGVLVSTTLKVFKYKPENKQKFAFIFPDWDSAVNAAREISQGEFGMPSVFRISDPEETDVGLKLYGVEGTVIDTGMSFRGYKPMQRCLYIGQADGEKDFAVNVKKNVKKICRKYGAMYLTGYPVKNWEHGRFADPYMREDLSDYGIMIDTLESGVTWDNLHNLHQGVRQFVKSRPNTVCMAHASHFYQQGTNLYFIFIAKMDDIDEYKEFQNGIIENIEKHGGSLSHHHGVGKMISPWMNKHLGKNEMGVLKALKNHFDPNNIMNPGGTLGLDL